MKKITYLIGTMLIALTMAGCQFDPSELEGRLGSRNEQCKIYA